MKVLFSRGGMGSIFILAAVTLELVAAEVDFRTDINPALLYFQAYQNMPQFSEDETAHLFDHPGAWPEGIDDRAIELLKKYDNAFKGLRRARFAKVACDWGYDLSDGPEALLPGLAPAKRLSQAARYRAMAALDADDFDAMRDDLAAVFVLGRNLSTDRILISALVQIAVENILTSVVMENYYRLSADQLDQLVAAFDSAPPRGTIAQTIPMEDSAFYQYIRRKVEGMIAQSNGNTEHFWEQFEAFWNPIATDVEANKGPEPSAADARAAAHGKTDELLKLMNEMPAYYAEMARIMGLAYPEYKEQAQIFFARIDGSTNPFIQQFFRVFKNVRPKEFSAMVRMQMVRAAAAYKLGGMETLKAVEDPLVGGAFEFSRVEFEGVDRGFRLKSREVFRDFDEVMIFLEKPGKNFRLDGKNAGTTR
ncbi:MAG: hypothetical protein ACXW32_13960 [Limisphaerales bacterium]